MRIRYSGLVAVVLLWSALGVAVARTGFRLLGPRPLSHLAGDPRSAALFGGALAIAALLFLALHHHLRQRYAVGAGFSVLMVAGMLGQFVAAVVPIGEQGQPNTVHVVAALLLGASIPLFLGAFALEQRPGRWRRLCFALFWLQVVASAAGLWLSAAQIAPLAEIIPAATFHLWVFAVTLKPRVDHVEIPFDDRPTRRPRPLAPPLLSDPRRSPDPAPIVPGWPA